MPLISDEQYSLLSRLTSLCLLAYLMPQTCSFIRVHPIAAQTSTRSGTGTGNTTTTVEGGEDSEMPPPTILLLDQAYSLRELEYILDTSPQIRHLPSSQYDPCQAHDERMSASFWDFLHSGLGRFLSSRPMSHAYSAGTRSSGSDAEPNCVCADLLHVLSMAISSDGMNMNMNMLAEDQSNGDSRMGSDENGADVILTPSKRVRCFRVKRQSEYFQISALERAKLVHVIGHHLVLPKLSIPQDNDSLLMDGILHLRSSLSSFSLSALSSRHVVDAKQGLVCSAIDTECFACVEMKALVQSLVSSKGKRRTGNPCNCRNRKKNAISVRVRELNAQNERFVYQGGARFRHSADVSTFRQQILYRQSFEKDICIHCAHGDFLCDLILRYNGSRHYADGVFVGQTLAELTCAIATLLGEIDSSHRQDHVDVAAIPQTCIIASLLDAARTLFYFLLRPDEDKISDDIEAKAAQELESGMKDALMECVVQLLGSKDRCIARSASSLLALAIAYENQDRVENVAVKIFATLKRSLRDPAMFPCDGYQDIVEVMSKWSSKFSASMIQFIICLLEKKGNDNKGYVETWLRVLYSASSHQPFIMSQEMDHLDASIGSDRQSEAVAKQLAAIYILCGGSVYNIHANEKLSEYLKNTLTVVVANPWSLFQIARLALTTANFQVASGIFGDKLATSLSSPSSFLWVSSLKAVARAEDCISQEGCDGIPTALTYLDKALNKIRSMSQDTSFQIEYISKRKDFLHMCVTLLNLCQEMRLTNAIGGLSTRNHLHQQNISRCFYMLSSRYQSIHKRYGMYNCQHTRSTIRSQFSLCRFLGDVTKLFFSGTQKKSKSSPASILKGSLDLPQGDSNRVQIQVIQKLRKELINSFDFSMEPSSRGEILDQILSTVMKCPNPYPKCFTNLKRIPKVKIQVASKDINQTFTTISLHDDLPHRPSYGSPFHLRVSGSFPEALFSKLFVPFSQVSAQFTFSPAGPLHRDADHEDALKNIETENEVNTSATSNLLPSDSKFIVDCECPPFEKEGFYFMQVKLLARDIRCGEYEIATNLSNERFVILASS